MDYPIFLTFTGSPLRSTDLALYLIDVGTENEGSLNRFSLPTM